MTAIEFLASLPMSRKSFQINFDDKKAAANIRNQLIERKTLHFRCRRVNDIMCFIAIFGLILMIINTEFQLNKFNENVMILISFLISISTVILVLLVLYYHALHIRLYTINNHIADWRLTLDLNAILFILFEVLVCIIHPFPVSSQSSKKNSDWTEMFLRLPMFARLYLIARSVTLHSSLVNAASSRTIGYLNRVPITISFILRAFLQTYPTGSWSCVMITTLLISTWSLRVCERSLWLPIDASLLRSNASAGEFNSAMWLTIVTFTTVGYGDVIPQTYCGQGVSAITALFGVFASAVLIAIFTSKISLNRAEQLVLDFTARIDRARIYREKTMQIIQYSVRAWFLKRHGHHYRATFNSLYRLHTAIRQARSVKQEQKNATNGNESLMTILSDVHDEQKSSEKSLNKLKQQIEQLENKINKLESQLNTVVNILTRTVPDRQHTSL